MKTRKKKLQTLHSPENCAINHEKDDEQQEDPFQAPFLFALKVNIVVGKNALCV